MYNKAKLVASRYWANFTFENLPEGNYQIYVYKVGTNTNSPVVYVNGESNKNLDCGDDNWCTGDLTVGSGSNIKPGTISLNITSSGGVVYICGGDTQKGPLPNDNYTHPPYLKKV